MTTDPLERVEVKISIQENPWVDEFELVSKQRFDEFINNYPRKLRRNVHMISYPATISFNDLTIAPSWPDCMVARHVQDEEGACGYEIRSVFLERPSDRQPQEGEG